MSARKYFPFLLFLFSCNGTSTHSTNAPIVLGDPATIVTERDTQYLVSYIPEYVPMAKPMPTEPEPTAAAKPIDTPKASTPTTPAAPVAAPTGKGQTIAFANHTLFVSGITVRDPNKATGNGVSYALTAGTLSNKTLQTTKGTLQQVEQQYHTAIWFDNGKYRFELKAIPKYVSSWEGLRNFNTGNLESSALRYTPTNVNALKNALDKALRNARVPRKELGEILQTIKANAKPDQAPFVVKLSVLRWKLAGKGTDGKPFRSQVRFDIP